MQFRGTELEIDNIRDLLLERANLGDKPLLICGTEILTFGDADERSNRVAQSLTGLGIGQGDVVATFMYNSVDHVVIWLACAKLGAVWASLNVSLASKELCYMISDTGAKLVVIDNEVLDIYLKIRVEVQPGLIEIIWGSRSSESYGFLPFETLLDGRNVLPDVDIAPSDPMAIIYTSGSTSMPKGVLVPHLYYLGAALRYQEITKADSEDVHFASSHLFHVGGQQFGLMCPLFCGVTGVLTKWFSVTDYWKIVRETSATIIDPIGTMMTALLTNEEKETDQNHNVRMGVGIATGQIRRSVRNRFEERFNVPLLEVYAMTEMGVLVCSERQDDKRAGSCGRPHGWAEILIVDDKDAPVDAGEVGEILLRPTEQNCFMLEYINKPKETVSSWRNLWYHTGDIGYLDEDGYLYFLGRQAHLIRHRGENVSSFEVEKALTEHPNVVDCGVVGVPGELGEEDIKVYVQVLPGSSTTMEELAEWCVERIATFKIPRYWEFVESFPRTITKHEISHHDLRRLGIGMSWDRVKRS